MSAQQSTVMGRLRSFYQGRRVLVTGHTGFKGAWLLHWLHRLGAQVSGFALEPETSPNLFSLTQAAAACEAGSVIADLVEPEAVRDAVTHARPEVVFHLGAQALVRRGYQRPIETFDVNVMGTVHLLEACRSVPEVRTIVVVTTDKCYENLEQIWPYREPDRLGGHDPYSASKACAELVVASYRKAFLQQAGVGLASARAGNVIGGGDWAEDRLIPDLVRGAQRNETITIRSPSATRPWQHVLDPLLGYLLLAERLSAAPNDFAEAWNFGPYPDPVTVGSVATRFIELLGQGAVDVGTASVGVHEAQLLAVDSTKAMQRLGWRPTLQLEAALAFTAEWYRAQILGSADLREMLTEQIVRFEQMVG
jgi:CDP-glucose 4,6-dehydratase